MKTRKVLKNSEIYTIVNKLTKHPIEDNTYIPVVFNFYIQKNIDIMFKLKEDIDQHRYSIISAFGEYDEEKQEMRVKPELISKANEELNNLAKLEQEVDLYVFPVGVLQDLKLTNGQLQSLMFMITEDDSFLQSIFAKSTKETVEIVLD